MGWGIAIAAAAQVYSSESAKGDAEDQQAERDALISGAGSDVFGSIPETVDWTSVDYNPLYENGGYADIQKQTIQGNLANSNDAFKLTGATNQFITNSNRNRIESWAPGFTSNLQLANTQAGQLLAGNVPQDVAQQIASQTAGNEATMGTAGTSGADMNRNLGLTSLQNIQSGMELLGGVTDITGAVDPLSMQMLPQSMFLSPSDAIQWSINENQFGTETEMQNNENQYAADVNNSLLEASADPTASGQFQLQYANTTPSASSGSSSQSYAAIASALSSYFGKSGGSTGYSGGTGTNGTYGSGYNLDYAPAGYK